MSGLWAVLRLLWWEALSSYFLRGYSVNVWRQQGAALRKVKGEEIKLKLLMDLITG